MKKKIHASNVKKIDLHDALLVRATIDHPNKTITVEVHYYRNEKSSERSSAQLLFSGVRYVSQLCDFERMAANAFAGNISYWKPELKEGTTYFYLAEGCISITARNLAFYDMSPEKT